jgi:hypothetical protein
MSGRVQAGRIDAWTLPSRTWGVNVVAYGTEDADGKTMRTNVKRVMPA